MLPARLPMENRMKLLAPLLALALAGCAAAPPAGKGAQGGGMMDEMCKRHAAEPGQAASAPEGMMDKHCKERAAAPGAAASHVH